MQISIPTQTPGSQTDSPAQINGTGPENGSIENIWGNSSGIWGSTASKKKKPGIFAKLLEGLSAKVKPELNSKKPALENSERTDGNLNLEKVKKSSREAGLAEKNAPPWGNFNDFGGKNSSLYLKNETNAVSAPEDLTSGRKTSKFLLPARQNDLASGFQNAVNPKKEDLLVLNAGSEEKNGVFDAGNLKKVPGNEESAHVWRQNSGKSSNGRSRADNTFSASFRELEAEILTGARQNLINPAKNSGGEKEGDRFSEIRGKKGRDRPLIEVRDLRTDRRNAQGEAGSVEVSKGSGSYGNISSGSALGRTSGTEIEIPLDLLVSGGKSENAASGKAGKETSTTGSFEEVLANELRGNLSADIVRDAAVIVRNGGEGTIHLSLKPATLGDVKIRLEMTENKITGHIIVESNDAFRAFERELPVLEKAFRDSGFSETTLDMSLAQDGWNFGAGGHKQDTDFLPAARLMAASSYESGSDWSDISTVKLPTGTTQVNLLV